MPGDSPPGSPAEWRGPTPGADDEPSSSPRRSDPRVPRGASDPPTVRSGSSAGTDGSDEWLSARMHPRSRFPRLARIENYFAPVRRPNAQDPSGRLDGEKPEWIAYLAGFLISVVAVVLILVTMAQYPLPSGGDPAEWIATSYPYVGIPYPTWIVPGQYPPLLFPLLGALVRAFGVIEAGRAFVALSTVLLGLSTYYLARSLVRSRSVALAVQAFVLLNPTLIQMFFWGGYPNILGLVFMNLAIGLFVRYVRSGTPWLAFLFWLSLGATILTHTLVALVLLGTLMVIFFFVLWQRWLPRSFYRSFISMAGAGIFLASVGGYYLITKVAGVAHPQYLQTSAFAFVKNGLGSLYSILLTPYFPGVKASVVGAEVASFVLAAIIVFLLVGLRLLAPGRLTLGMITTLGMIVTVVGGAVVGWELSIVTDYLRFGYFLVLPIGLALGLVVDGLLQYRPSAGRALRPFQSSDRGSVGDAPAVGRLPSRGARRRAHGWSTVGTLALALFAIFVVLSTTVVTQPSLGPDEQAYAASFHDRSFLNALRDIQDSGVPGSVFTVGGAAKWTRAILDRNAYTPFIANRFTFDPSHLDYEETAYFAMVAQDSITNNLVAATIAGTNATLDNETPDYEASFFGAFTPVATLLPQDFNVTVALGNRTHTAAVTAAPIIVPPSGPSAAMQLKYVEPDFTFTVGISIPTGAPSATYTLSATGERGWNITEIRGNLTGPAVGIGSTNFRPGPATGEEILNPTGIAGGPGSLLTYVNVTPASAFVGHAVSFNHGALVSRQGVEVLGSGGGVASLDVGFTFTTPLAENLINDLPPFIDTPAVWANWSVRFVLLTNQSQFVTNHPTAIFWDVPYLVGEYGARVLAVEGSWTVLLLPAVG